jgi:hypothetical protein
MTIEDFGELFRSRMNELCDGETRRSLRKISEELGRSHGYLDERYNNPTKVYVRDIIAICERFQLPLSYFMEDDNSPEREQKSRFEKMAAQMDTEDVEHVLWYMEHYKDRAKTEKEKRQQKKEGLGQDT